MSTADDVKRVFQATNSCKTVDEIIKSTGLDEATVQDCINTLDQLGVVAKDQIGRVCNYNAVKSMQDKFTKICAMCGDK